MTASELELLRRRDPVAAAEIDALCAQLRDAGKENARLQTALRDALNQRSNDGK